MLDKKSMEDLRSFILSPQCKNIAVLTGAGISVEAGIPDFRSPGGMYDTLRPELITATKKQKQRMKWDPTEVVDKQMFNENQFPYLEVCIILISHFTFNMILGRSEDLSSQGLQNKNGKQQKVIGF